MYSQPNPQSSPLHPWNFPDKSCQQVQIDYACPVGCRMFLIIIDAHSKWAEVIPTHSSMYSVTTDIIYTIFARFDVPNRLVSDNGTQFVSEEFKIFTRTNTMRHIASAPYQPGKNGIAERFVKSSKTLQNLLKRTKVPFKFQFKEIF